MSARWGPLANQAIRKRQMSVHAAHKGLTSNGRNGWTAMRGEGVPCPEPRLDNRAGMHQLPPDKHSERCRERCIAATERGLCASSVRCSQKWRECPAWCYLSWAACLSHWLAAWKLTNGRASASAVTLWARSSTLPTTPSTSCPILHPRAHTTTQVLR